MNTALVVIASALALMLQAPASIHGVLTDASGAVIPGAAVSLSGADIQRVGQTQARAVIRNGAFY